MRGPSEKQAEFLLSDVEELLYGGAVRGGKTYALMAALVMYHDVPTHSGIIFRKSRDDLFLPDGPYDISVRWGWDEKGAHWDGSKYRYTFPSGKTITFGYMGEPRSLKYKRYKSSWFQDIFFDQVEEIPFVQYDWMRNRLGRLVAYSYVPLRFWATANPDGFEWVYERFVKKETRIPGTLFIPATAADNPWVDLKALEATLSKISDPITYKQLMLGVWGLSSFGGMFDPSNFELTPVLPTGQPLIGVRYWDLASTDEMESGRSAFTCGVRMFRDLNTNHVYVYPVVRERWSPLKVETALATYAALDLKFCDTFKIRRLQTWIEQEPGSSGKAIIDHYVRDVLPGYAVFGDRVTGSKEDRAQPWAAAVARKLVHLVVGEKEGSAIWIEPYRQEHRQFPGGEYKDQVDASSGAYNKLFDVARAPKVRHA